MDRGTSGPTTVKQSFFSAKPARPPMSSAATNTLSRVPPFPGAVNTVSTALLWDSFQERACSLPPDPTTRTLANAVLWAGAYITEVMRP